MGGVELENGPNRADIISPAVLLRGEALRTSRRENITSDFSSALHSVELAASSSQQSLRARRADIVAATHDGIEHFSNGSERP